MLLELSCGKLLLDSDLMKEQLHRLLKGVFELENERHSSKGVQKDTWTWSNSVGITIQATAQILNKY